MTTRTSTSKADRRAIAGVNGVDGVAGVSDSGGARFWADCARQVYDEARASAAPGRPFGRGCVGLAVGVEPSLLFRTADANGDEASAWASPGSEYWLVVTDDPSGRVRVRFAEPVVRFDGRVTLGPLGRWAFDRFKEDLEPGGRVAAVVAMAEIGMTSRACRFDRHWSQAARRVGWAGADDRLHAGRQQFSAFNKADLAALLPRAWVAVDGGGAAPLRDWVGPEEQEALTQALAEMVLAAAVDDKMPPGFYRQACRRAIGRGDLPGGPSWQKLCAKLRSADAAARAAVDVVYSSATVFRVDDADAVYLPASWVHALFAHTGEYHVYDLPPAWEFRASGPLRTWDPGVDAFILPALPLTPPWPADDNSCLVLNPADL